MFSMTTNGGLDDRSNKRPTGGGDGASLKSALGQIVLVFQGGGALGAYQVGVYQALHEAGIEPDWVICHWGSTAGARWHGRDIVEGPGPSRNHHGIGRKVTRQPSVDALVAECRGRSHASLAPDPIESASSVRAA